MYTLRQRIVWKSNIASLPHWPQDCVSLWPSGWEAPPQHPAYYHDPERGYLENKYMERRCCCNDFSWFLLCVQHISWIPVTVAVSFKLTFPYSGQQIKATVCVQSLQQVLKPLWVWVVQLERENIMKGYMKMSPSYAKPTVNSHVLCLTRADRCHSQRGAISEISQMCRSSKELSSWRGWCFPLSWWRPKPECKDRVNVRQTSVKLIETQTSKERSCYFVPGGYTHEPNDWMWSLTLIT